MVKIFRRKISLGFSLIEILVTTGIMALVLSMALVSYSRVVRRQRFEQGVQNILEEFRLARDLALSGEKPDGCEGVLDEYEFIFSSSFDSYQIRPVCGGVEYPAVKTGAIDESIQVGETYFQKASFFPLGAGLVISGFRNKGRTTSYWVGAVEFISAYDPDVTRWLFAKYSGETYLGNEGDELGCYYYYTAYGGYGSVPCDDPEAEDYMPCCPPYECTWVIQGGGSWRCQGAYVDPE